MPQPIEAVKGWLLERNPEIEDLDPDLDLIENRVIDSLRLIEFVYFLEEIAERELAVDERLVAALRTLRSIEREVLDGSAAA